MAGWLPSQPANLTLIRSKNARLGSSLACLATNVCIGLKKSRLFLYQIVDGLAFLCRPLMWNESILVKGAAASCLYSTLLGVTLSVHCVGEQSDPTLLFQGLLQFCSPLLCSQIGVHVVSHYGGRAAGGGLRAARTEGQFL